MLFKYTTGAIAALAIGTLAAGGAFAQDTVKIGLVVAMTGQQASTGKQIKAAVDLYMKEHGDKVAGKKIEVILRDSGSVPDNTKRLSQELIVKDKVSVIAGFEITPAALVVAPLATEAKVVQLVMAAGTSIITERSPYIARTSFTVPQSCVIIADWAAKNIKKVVTIVPTMRRLDAENRSPNASRQPAAPSPRRSGYRSPIRTSRRSCNAPPTPSRTPSSSSCRRAKAAPS